MGDSLRYPYQFPDMTDKGKAPYDGFFILYRFPFIMLAITR